MRQSRLHQERKRFVRTTALLQTWFYSLDSRSVTPHKSTPSMASSSCLARILICPLLCLAPHPHPQEEAFRLFLQHTSFLRASEDHALLSCLHFLIFITYKTEKVHYVQEFYLQHCTFRSLCPANAAKQRALVAVDHLSSGIPLYLLLLSTFIVLMQFKRRKMVIDKMLKKNPMKDLVRSVSVAPSACGHDAD